MKFLRILKKSIVGIKKNHIDFVFIMNNNRKMLLSSLALSFSYINDPNFNVFKIVLNFLNRGYWLTAFILFYAY